jgi:4-amino-4-deoxy-L-arabinose transferase-like glycosyltransferase
VLAAILVGSAAIKLPNLGHRALRGLDESFHAIVAQNLMKHPWLPTLHDGPAIDVHISDWQNSKLFLHKPPMAMWQIALSYALFGVNSLALRLPSLLLSTLAVWLTYQIGRHLVDETAGLVAAALQAFNPVIAMLVHGNVFSDHVDISLLFWTELAIWLFLRAMRSGKKVDLALCGVAQGFAFLSKLYPALIVTVLVVVAVALSRKRPMGPRIGLVLGATLITVLPWNLYAFMRWPDQFIYEHLHALRHLSQDIEQYAGPWDRLVFDYWVQVFHVYYPAVLVAAIVVVIRAWRLKDARLWFLVAWAVGVLIPHLVATSKTPTATLIGWPPFWVMFGYLVSQATRGCGMSAGAWAATMVLPLILLQRGHLPTGGWGYPAIRGFAVIMFEQIWVVWYVLAALCVGVLAALGKWRRLRLSLCVVAAASMLILSIQFWSDSRPRGYGLLCWDVRNVGKNEPAFPQIARLARRLPREAVFIVDEQLKLENKTLQFYARRSCYPLRGPWQDVAQIIVDAGGLPYLVSDKPLELPRLIEGDGRVVYACTPRAYDAARHE